MEYRRSRLEMALDVLRAVKEGREKPTHAMFRANTSWTTLKKYLKWLVEKGFVKEMEGRGRKTYRITEKGERILEYFEKMEEEIPLAEIP
jgi:predicted transcriptional regulator